MTGMAGLLLLLGLVALTLVALTAARGVLGPSTSNVLTVAGSLVILVSFALLPWVYFNPVPGAETLHELRQGLTQNEIVQRLGAWWEGVVGERLSGEEPAARDVEGSSERERWNALVAADRPLTGWAILRHVPYKGFFFRILLVAALILPLSGMICALTALFARSATRVLAAFNLVLSLLAIFLVLAQLPVVDTFGIRYDIARLTQFFEAGTNTGSGIWGVLVGSILLAVGSALAVQTGEEEPMEEYSSEWDMLY